MACPIRFAINCKYQEVRCHECKALGNGKGLLYKPLNSSPSIEEHPGYELPNTSKSKRGKLANSRGRRLEKKIVEAVGGTHNRASIGYDGLLDRLGIRIEVKTRLIGSNYLTRAEWDKAKRQGNEIGIVKVGNAEPRVCMSLSTLTKILGYIP
jgi:hypothetical protein